MSRLKQTLLDFTLLKLESGVPALRAGLLKHGIIFPVAMCKEVAL